MSLAPTTELEAVNTMLNTIGEAPVNTLVNMTSVDASSALSILNSVNREVQSQGWFFNTEYNYPLTLNQDSELPLPANTLSMDSTTESEKHDVVQRGFKAYDRLNHTFTFTEAVKADLVVLLDFGDIPEAAKNYIVLRASRIFQDRTLSSDSLHQMNREDEYLALTTLRLKESENADYNILTGNYSVSRILTR